MEENMMQQGQQAPPAEGGDLQQKVMQIADDLMAAWRDTGKIQDKKITDEKEAKRLAVAIALRQVEQEAQMAQREQAPPPPQAPPQGGGMPPQGGGGPMMM